MKRRSKGFVWTGTGFGSDSPGGVQDQQKGVAKPRIIFKSILSDNLISVAPADTSSSGGKKPIILASFDKGMGVSKFKISDDTIDKISSISEKALDATLTFIGDLSIEVEKKMESLDKKPSEIELNFGIKTSGEINYLVITGSLEADIGVRITWKN